MVDAGIGRLLIASLHQGIADVSPTRLDFYENWLSPTGLRDGRLGMAPLGAVLSFVHRETPPDNDRIPERAGTCAAEWTYASAAGVRQRMVRRMPLSVRTRSALRLGRTLVRETVADSRITTSLRGGTGVVEVRSSLFDYLRETASTPMRRFYAAAFAEILRLSDIAGSVEVDAAALPCRLIVTFQGEKPPSQAIFDVT